MTCKGICSRYKAQKPVGTGRYASGQRRCQICEIFIKWEGLWCPCCGYRLRTKPRNLKYKAKLRARVEADAKVEAKEAKSKVEKYHQRLDDWIKSEGIQAVGKFYVAQYNSPWALPPFRHNEILVRIKNEK